MNEDETCGLFRVVSEIKSYDKRCESNAAGHGKARAQRKWLDSQIN